MNMRELLLMHKRVLIRTRNREQAAARRTAEAQAADEFPVCADCGKRHPTREDVASLLQRALGGGIGFPKILGVKVTGPFHSDDDEGDDPKKH